MLLLADLCDLAGDFEGCGCAVGIGYGDFGFSGAAVADGDGESGAVCVAGSSLFDDIYLHGVKGEDPQGEADLMAGGDGFTVVGVDKIPGIRRLAGKLLNGKCEFIDAIGEGFGWQGIRRRCGASRQQQKQGQACAYDSFHGVPPTVQCLGFQG